MIVQRHRSVAGHGERRAAPGGRGGPGREGGPVQSRPAPPPRPPGDRGRRTRPEIVDAHENELIRTEEQAARDKCSLTLHDNGDGTTTGHFTIPALAAAMLGKVIDAMTAPRRMRERNVSQTGPSVRLAAPPRPRVRRAPRAPPHRPPAPQDRSHRRGHHRPHRPRRCDEGSPPRHRPDALRRRSPPRSPATPASSPPSSAPSQSPSTSAARAGSSPSPSESPKGLEHTTCAATGCERPYAWCELHHRQPWARGGTHRPRRRDPALPPAPPLDPRHRLQPPDPARRQHQIQQADVRIGVQLGMCRGSSNLEEESCRASQRT